MRDAGELEGVFEAVEHAGAIVHAAGKGAGFNARVASRRARREIAAQARPEDAYPAGIDCRNFFEIIDHGRSRSLELDDQSALNPALPLTLPVTCESTQRAT